MQTPSPRRKPRPESIAVGALLTVLVALGQISTALYIPSMPSLVVALGTDAGMVNLTLSVYLAGFAVSQLVYGPLSDRFGRRRVLLAGMTLYLLASLGCAVSPTIGTLMTGRFLQALGACAGPVLGRAIVRDIYGADRAAQALAYIGMAFAISPAITPMIGGFLQVWFGWQANFLFLAGLGASILLAVAVMLEETNLEPDPRALDLRDMARNYATLLSTPVYLGHTFGLALIFGGLMAYVAVSPFLFIDVLGLSPDRFGMLAIFNAAGTLIGNGIAGRLTMRLGVVRMVLLGIVMSLAGAATMTAIALGGHMSVAAIIAPMAVFLAGMGVVFPNAMAGAMGPFPRMAGAASAFLGFTQMAVAAVASIVAGWLPQQTQLPMSLVILGFSAAALVVFVPLVWREGKR